MAIGRKRRQHQESASASASAVVITNSNTDDKMKKKSSSYHRRNSQNSNSNDDYSESSALSAAGALLELGAPAAGVESSNSNINNVSKKKVHRGKTMINDTLRHSSKRYRGGNVHVRALYRPILPRHPTEISDDDGDDNDDENCSTRQRSSSSSIRVPSTVQVHFHNYNTAATAVAATAVSHCGSIPGDIGNINLTVASPGWIGQPLGPPPRLPFGSRNRFRLLCNVGPIPNGSPIYSNNSSNNKGTTGMNGIHISH